MSRKIFAGVANFEKIIKGGGLYVDKSDFIEELLNFGDEVIAIARPRRFGKTLNMSMLSYFFDINNGEENKKLFKGLKIEKSPYFSEQGQYPVINMTFKDVKERSWDKCIEKIKSIVSDEFIKHKYLLEGEGKKELEKKDKDYFKAVMEEEISETKLKDSLKRLSQFLHQYFGKEVVILVDEYDTPIIEGELAGYFKEASNFMQSFLSGALKGVDSLHKGVVTGITRLQGAGIFSGLNNADVCTVFENSYKNKFGFTEKEVKKLLGEYRLEDKGEEIREYYNGYNFRGEVIYNPYSVVKCIAKGEFSNFWLGSSSNDLAKMKLKKLIEIGDGRSVRKLIEDLIQGKAVTTTITGSIKISEEMTITDILNLFIYSGYLRYEAFRVGDDGLRSAEVMIPNREVKEIYRGTVEEWVEERYSLNEILEFKVFLDSICEGDEKAIKEGLESYLEGRSTMDVERVEEMGYHNFFFGMMQGLKGRYDVESNRESGSGRYDILLTPTKRQTKFLSFGAGIVIEFKVGKKEQLKKISENALKQIEEKKYYKSLEGKGINKARLIGIAFNKKEAEVTLKEIKLTR